MFPMCFKSTNDSADLSTYSDIDQIHEFEESNYDAITENDSYEEEIAITTTVTDINASNGRFVTIPQTCRYLHNSINAYNVVVPSNSVQNTNSSNNVVNNTLEKIRLFEEHQELLDLFTRFKDLRTKEDQSTSLELAEHAGTVMNTIDEGIRSLDNLDAFFEYMHQVGASHRKVPGFKVEYFWVSTLS
ncbi:hypothetical protein FQA39_LY13305 [Lamprigera yunnana]|nr:hypothetical protein FQA39_LY13305 [Lamprigera yunnana]